MLGGTKRLFLHRDMGKAVDSFEFPRKTSNLQGHATFGCVPNRDADAFELVLKRGLKSEIDAFKCPISECRRPTSGHFKKFLPYT
jgi:hypothetical protein